MGLSEGLLRWLKAIFHIDDSANPQTAAFILNTDLETINGLSHNWLVDFNPTKTSTLLISRRQHPVFYPSQEMNNVVLNETTSHKHLLIGLTISNACSWIEHIHKIEDTAWSRLNLMRLLKFKINQKALEKMYIAFIHPLLDYSDSVWDNSPAHVKKQLDNIHYEAARIIT